jgi:hypothetical protein
MVFNIYINIIILIIALVFHNLSQKYVFIKGEKECKKRKPLYDILLNNFNVKNQKLKKIFCKSQIGLSDSITYFVFLFTILYLFLNKDKKVINNSIIIIYTLTFLRSILFNLTILPKPAECNLKFIGGGCYDLMFSGHYIYLTLSLYLIIYIFNINIIYKIVFGLLFILSIISTVLCKKHYSIDIVVSIVLTYLLSYILLNKSKLN